MCSACHLPSDRLVLSISNEGMDDSDFEASDNTACVCICMCVCARVRVCTLQPDFYQSLPVQRGKCTAKEALTHC